MCSSDLTCEQKGSKKVVCLVGKEESLEEILELGHNYEEWKVIKEPTESEDGEKESTCTRCFKITKVIIPSDAAYESKEGLQHLESFVYNNNAQRLEIHGFLAIKGVDNLDTKAYSIEFVNEKTNEKIVYKLSPQLTGYPFEVPSEGGKNLKYSWYKDSINLELLPEGDYTANIVARQDGNMTRKILSNIFSKSITKKGVQGNRGYTFTTNYFNKSIPIEITVRNGGLISHKQPPSDVSMFNTMYKIDFENNKLRIVGTSFNVGASYSNTDNVKRQVIFENIETYERFLFDASYIENGPYSIKLTVPDNMSKFRGWFDETIDIANLPKGKYAIHIRTYTNDVDDSSELNDIFVTDLSSKKMTFNNKNYSLNINNNNYFIFFLILF